MVLVSQGCEPKCTEVGVLTTDQLMHSLDEDAFANIQLLKSENILLVKACMTCSLTIVTSQVTPATARPVCVVCLWACCFVH